MWKFAPCFFVAKLVNFVQSVDVAADARDCPLDAHVVPLQRAEHKSYRLAAGCRDVALRRRHAGAARRQHGACARLRRGEEQRARDRLRAQERSLARCAVAHQRLTARHLLQRCHRLLPQHAATACADAAGGCRQGPPSLPLEIPSQHSTARRVRSLRLLATGPLNAYRKGATSPTWTMLWSLLPAEAQYCSAWPARGCAPAASRVAGCSGQCTVDEDWPLSRKQASAYGA